MFVQDQTLNPKQGGHEEVVRLCLRFGTSVLWRKQVRNILQVRNISLSLWDVGLVAQTGKKYFTQELPEINLILERLTVSWRTLAIHFLLWDHLK